ncbi:hypothetical protein DL766_008231 [Monosporascus sp. MC13-8B]|uniref:MIF4G domain-containing protein n=1 Tax=Monosporascus cannonballus TaxID=155416 RepID=A0ABY0GTP7_9PEZI|nr:hypothetical protein DL762_009632 [Monosporascus cannonballus]RYO98117.1 hypothetical protein DL763_002437 [Monosporascus cannonballus]RYP20262.1 hypothetical protein DL766_008231 [Monosporascus sp. MC13-8B]
MYHQRQIGYGHDRRGHRRHELLPHQPHRVPCANGLPMLWEPRLVYPGPQGVLFRQLEFEIARQGGAIEVQLPQGLTYVCNRVDLLEHLPNIRHRLVGRVLRVGDLIARPNRTALVVDALSHIFRGFELHRTTGLKVDLFERARNHLHNGRNIDEILVHAVNAFIGVCEALDSEGGLGCSDDLLGQIDEFVIELKEDAHFGPWNYRVLEGLFAAYSKVFQQDMPRHMYTLRALWSALDIKLRARLLTELSRELDRHSQRSNIQAMYRALSDMNMI